MYDIENRFVRSLYVLGWKDVIISIRKKYLTIFQLAYPLVPMFLLYRFRNTFIPSSDFGNLSGADNTFMIKEEKFLDEASLPRCLLYTPVSELTGALMDEVGRQLHLTRLYALPNKTKCKGGFYPYSNEDEISGYLQSFYRNEAVIIFDDMAVNSWSERTKDGLSYTIRMKDRFHTDTIKSYGSMQQDHKDIGDKYNNFMRIQWAIDTSYIKLRSGHEVPQTLSLQEFPFPLITLDVVDAIYVKVVILYTTCCVAVANIFTDLCRRMMSERSKGIQELIKLNGVSINSILWAYVLNEVGPSILFCAGSTLAMKLSDDRIVDHTYGIIIFVGLFLYVLTIIASGMACSYIADSAEHAMVTGIFMYLGSLVVMLLVGRFPPANEALVHVCGLLLHVPMQWMFLEIGYFELYEESYMGIFTSHADERMSIVGSYVCMVVQCALYSVLTWYLSKVRQGKFGRSLPWNFCLLSDKKQHETDSPVTEDEEDETIDGHYFEKPYLKDMEVGIRVENVSKGFPRAQALKNVTLNAYKGEILVLVGHNGAGKTTLISIISGMTSPSTGKVFVNGIETSSRTRHVRRDIGLYPQQNQFIPNLNVIENVVFFTLMKDESCVTITRASSLELLNRLGIEDKATSKPEELSGGMRRRLQLACALAGGSNVLVLDEPTSGLDLKTRREIWDLLLSLRGHTVLLSTHYMEDADALGDRVAALHTGTLRCHATPFFLKKAMGTGFRLTLTCMGYPQEFDITSEIVKHVATASVKECTYKTITYNLPSFDKTKFSALFASLEVNRLSLGIETIKVAKSSLHEIFLKLCSNTKVLTDEELNISIKAQVFHKIQGRPLYRRQAWILFKRHLDYVKHRIYCILFLHILIPGLLVFLFTMNAVNYTPKNDPEMPLDLNIFKTLPEQWALINVNVSGASLRTTLNYENVKFAVSRNITKDMLRMGQEYLKKYNTYLIGLELDDGHAKALYTTWYRHTAPVALNLLSNILASSHLPEAAASITLRNRPIGGVLRQAKPPIENSLPTVNCLIWAVLVTAVVLFTNANFGILLRQETATAVRHLHIMAGCPAVLHWCCTLLFHVLMTALTVVPVTLLCVAAVDTKTLGQPRLLMALALVLILGSISFFGVMYVIYVILNEKLAVIVTATTIVAFAILTPIMSLGVDYLKIDKAEYAEVVLNVLAYVIPQQTLTMAACKIAYTGRLNALCYLNRDQCPDLLVVDRGFDIEKCCEENAAKDYFAMDTFAPGVEIIILIIQAIVYMMIVIFLQMAYFKVKCVLDTVDNLNIKKIIPAAKRSEDEYVAAEEDYVDAQILLPVDKIKENNVIMLCSHLHKTYTERGTSNKIVSAVTGISFSVKKGECFGLLGSSGAGKSSTFGMLTSEICPTKGKLYCNGYFLNRNKMGYLYAIGYCPQFGGVDEFQTGADNLRTLLVLRGYRDEDIEKEIALWFEIFGLQKYCKVHVRYYSAGFQRRLAAACALGVGAPITLLDEPTAGVDVGARRRMSAALKMSLMQERSILITSHNMEEMESLCARIAIIVGGTLRALGSPAELRERYAKGHSVIFKISPAQKEKNIHRAVGDLKAALETKYNCTLIDEHKTTIHYHISDRMNYSQLFSQLEAMRLSFKRVIEDYSVAETTLQEVFLHFARGLNLRQAMAGLNEEDEVQRNGQDLTNAD